MNFESFVRTYPQLGKYNNVLQAFQKTCENGDLELAKIIFYNFPDIDINCGMNGRKYAVPEYVFRWSCYNGHFEMAQWLKSICPEIDHRSHGDFAFKHTSLNLTQLSQWIVSLYDIADANILVDFCLLQYNIPMAKFIIEYFDISELFVSDNMQWQCDELIQEYQSKFQYVKSANKL